MNPTTRHNARIDAIEQLKGVAIILVVAAHLVKHGTLFAADWYEIFKYKIYLFHMPLFMFASGYVFFHTGAHRTPPARLPAYGARRADRLLVPFLALGLITLAGKLALSGIAYVDEAPSTLPLALADAVSHTESSPVLTIWYLFVLFVFCLATPVLYRLAGGRMVLLALLAACLYPLPTPDFLFANRITGFYIFFVAGGLAQSWRLLEHPRHPLPGLFCIAVFALMLMLPLRRDVGLVLCGLTSCLAIPVLLTWMPVSLRAAMQFCGRHCMSIYLFNVIAIGVAKAAFLRLFTYDAALFVPLLCVTFAAGIGLPLLLKWASGLTPRTALIHRYIR